MLVIETGFYIYIYNAYYIDFIILAKVISLIFVSLCLLTSEIERNAASLNTNKTSSFKE